MTTTLIVGTADLRQALTAVRPHACTDSDMPELVRIRLTIGPQTVAVTATDRYTAGLAIASTWDHDGEPGERVDLLPDDVSKILSIFKCGKESGADDGPQYLLRLDIDSEYVTITDCSGMIDGRRYRMPRLVTDDALDAVPVLVDQAHSGKLVALDGIENMTVSGEHLARFRVAASAYDHPLQLEARAGRRTITPTILVRCGESMLGLMMPRRLLDEDLIHAREWAQSWSARLPGLIPATAGSAQS